MYESGSSKTNAKYRYVGAILPYVNSLIISGLKHKKINLGVPSIYCIFLCLRDWLIQLKKKFPFRISSANINKLSFVLTK